jgi:hypothetical protein
MEIQKRSMEVLGKISMEVQKISMEILGSLDPSGPQKSSEVFRNPSSRVKVEHELTIF